MTRNQLCAFSLESWLIWVSGGAIQAFDSREENSTAAGHLGGVG